MPRRRSSVTVKSARSSGHLAHDPIAGLDQEPAHALGGAAGVEVEDLRREILRLGDHLDARIAPAGDDEGEVLRADVGLVDRLGDLEAPQERVAQVERLEDALEADRVLREPRNREVARDRAERHDQLVVEQLP